MKKILFASLIVLMCLMTTGCFKSSIEKKQITNNAINYLVSKYNFDKSKLKVVDNRFYGKSERCFVSCGENNAIIIYEDKKFYVAYDRSKNVYGDNYEYDKVYNDLETYLKNTFPFATKIKIDSLESCLLSAPDKYNGNIVDFMKKYVRRGVFGNYTWIHVWISEEDEIGAKKDHEEYSKTIITTLETLSTSYNVAFSKKELDNEYFAYYYYHVSDNISPSFNFKDNINKKSTRCQRENISYNGNELKCD